MNIHILITNKYLHIDFIDYSTENLNCLTQYDSKIHQLPDVLKNWESHIRNGWNSC